MRTGLTLATRRLTTAVATIALTLTTTLMALPARADTAPADATLPQTVSSDALPTAQIDGIAWDQDIAGDTVYVGGRFTSVRPAGAAPGTSTVPRSHMMAYDIRTGQHTAFAPTFNAQVRQLAVSPDGTRVYAVGEFTSVNGVRRDRIAAFSTATGQLVSTFAPTVNARIASVTATDTTVYIGGIFSSVGGQARTRIAAVRATNGAVLPPVGSAGDGQVSSLVVSPDGTQLVAGGSFTTFNGSAKPGYGLARVSTSTGQLLALPVNDLIRNGGVNSSITSLSSDGENFYGSGYHFGSGGNLEGTFAARWSTGALVWVEDCHGDTYQSAPVGDVVYSASHKHYCGNVGGFPQTDPWTFSRATAVTKAVRGTVTKDPHGYFNFAGNPAPKMLNWYPTLDTGTVSGANQGPWAVTGDSRYVVMGGEFRRVNNVPQQGLVRFAVRAIAPNDDGPRLAGAAFNPRAVSVAPGEVRVDWRGSWDRDNETLTYRLYREGTAAPVVEHTVTTPFWTSEDGRFVDTGRTPGATHRYRITATDPLGNVARSEWVAVTVATTQTARPYVAGVLADGASSLWRLGEPSGTAVRDWAGFTDLVAGTGVTRGAAGAVAGDADRASTFDGTANGFAATQRPVVAPSTFSLEAWVRTTSTTGGKLIGFGDARTKASTNYDRHLYLDDAGRIFFGVHPGAVRTVNSTASYNDGRWHHVVATLGAGGMHLYVDGAVVAKRTDVTTAQALTGYWRVGSDTLSTRWTSSPTSDHLAAVVDDVAVYDGVLSAERVAAHFTPPAPPAASAPTAAFTATSTGLTASVDASGSTDADGTITAYAWDFGDGSTATGRTATRTYAAAGTYTVTLRVTDDTGRTGSATRSVTVSAPAPEPEPTGDLARDTFTRTVSGGWGTAEAGGAWTRSGATANFAVSGGVGRQVMATAGTSLTALLPVTATDTEVRATVALDKPATGGGTYLSVIGRQVGTAGDYRGRLRMYPNGAVVAQTARGGTAIGAVTVAGLTYAPGERLAVRLQVRGTSPTTLRIKVWRAGGAEPAAWQVSSTDSTPALQTGGGVGLGSLLSSTATNAPVVAAYDDVWAGPPRD